MAYPENRSWNEDLHRGMTDGSYKKLVANRGGVVESLTTESRRTLRDVWYGFHEAAEKMLPDGRICVLTSDTVTLPEAEADL
jgi:hypothetical protein